jgi:hypothetical protein
MNFRGMLWTAELEMNGMTWDLQWHLRLQWGNYRTHTGMLFCEHYHCGYKDMCPGMAK